MAILGVMFRACSVVGHGSKSPLNSRFVAALYQQTAGYSKASTERKPEVPVKPKRPMSAFLLFATSVRPKLMAQYPGLKAPEIMKKAGEEYRTCDPAIKEKIIEQSHKNAQEYSIALQKYHRALSDEDHQAIEEAKAEAKKARMARRQRKTMRKLDKPKRPPNSFLLFLTEQDAKGAFKDCATALEKTKKGSEMWKKAPESVVTELRERTMAAYRQYKLDLQAWEEKMVASGHVDVLSGLNPKSKKKA